MPRTLSMFGVLVAILGPRALAAQRLAQLPETWRSHSLLDQRREPPVLTSSVDYRLEGAVVGGVLLGAGGVLLGSFPCADPATDGSPRSCRGQELWAGAVGLAAGAVLGYFIGRSVHK